MTARFDRRAALQLGVAGLFASHLVGLRASAQNAGAPPRRIILFYVPEGIHWRYWLSKSLNSDTSGGRTQEVPLSSVANGDVFHPASNIWSVLTETFASVRGNINGILNEVNVIDGICNAGAGSNSHDDGLMAFKGGFNASNRNRPTTFGGSPGPSTMSIERLIARGWFGANKPANVLSEVLNLQLINTTTYTEAHPDWFGWGGSSTTVKPASNAALDPSVLWRRLFEGLGGSSGPMGSPASTALQERLQRFQRRQAVTRAEIEAAKKNLGRLEQQTLVSYLDALTQVENRIKDQLQLQQPQPSGSTCMAPPVRNQAFSKTDYLDLVRNVSEQLAMAFACDRIRAVNLMNWGSNASSNVTIAPGFSGDWHTKVGHSIGGGNEPGAAFFSERYPLQQIVLRAFGELVAALKRQPEGTGSVLDSTTILLVSEHSGHDHRTDLPHMALMAGGGGRKSDGSRVYRTGRYIKLATSSRSSSQGQSFSNLRNANDLCLTLAHGAGVTTAAPNGSSSGAKVDLAVFGDPELSQGPLAI
jgi:hypothetical protein